MIYAMRFCNGHHARAMLCLHGQVVQHHALRPMHPHTAEPCEVATVSPRTPRVRKTTNVLQRVALKLVECRSYLYLAQTLSVKGKAGHVVPGSDLKIKPSVAPSNLHRALAVHAKRSDLRITECKERLQAVVTGDDDLLVALKNSDGHVISCGQPDGWICPDDSALEIDR